MKIEPTYVTFEQAKLLKRKGFDVSCIRLWNGIGKYFEDKPYTDWNKATQFISIPEQGQVIEWLRVVHGIWIEVHGWTKQPVGDEIWEQCYQSFINGDATDVSIFKTPQEAYSAAFDYTLKELI